MGRGCGDVVGGFCVGENLDERGLGKSNSYPVL